MRLRPLNPFRRGKIDVDLFAGGGGASDGARRATGRSPHVAVNHWPVAISMHEVNHPDCLHMCEDVRKVKPLDATAGRLVRTLWGSPTCAHFSRASGARLSPETIKIRGLAWMVMPWIIETRPDTIIIENVIEFLQWGPVCWQHHEVCCGDSTGKSCVDECGYGRPIRSRAGETFRAWQLRIESFGYSVEARVLEAWEFGAPTMRKRVYVVCRSNGKAYSWPETTHVRPELVESTGKRSWRTAAEIIDWSIPCPSIFDRKKPHVPATRRRIAKGMRKFVLETGSPFLMHLTHGDRHAPHSVDVPVPTVTGANRGEQSIVVPFMVHRSNGERPGQEPRTYDVNTPHPTAVGGGIKTAPVVAFFAKAYGERATGGWNGGTRLDKPTDAITAQDHHHLVVAHAVNYGTSSAADCNEPLHTVTAGAEHHALATYALAPEWNDIIAAKARRVYHFLVEERVDGPWMDHANQLVIVPALGLVVYDIGMRMLVPRELFRANGFHDTYVIELCKANGKPLTKTEQVRLVGNSVCPDVAEALVRAALRLRRRPEPIVSPQLRLWQVAA